MNETLFNKGLIKFIKASPTPFHAVAQLETILEGEGFIRLNEASSWKMKKNTRYYVTRNDSSLIAFTLGNKPIAETGLHMAGSHTDSPCLKIKPDPEIITKGHLQLGVEVYGGTLLTTWYDRELSIAGRVSYLTEEDRIHHVLVNFKKPVAIIPSLAIHLDREANTKKSVNPQNDLPPVLLTGADDHHSDFRKILSAQIKKEHKLSDIKEILDFELCFYDERPPQISGLKNDFITGARLDNLISCYVGIMGMVESSKKNSNLMVMNDHEEVGSTSTSGAQGQFLLSVLKRIEPDSEKRIRAMAASMMISIDNAHGIHPNYIHKYDGNHAPVLNGGPVIKTNANQRYASNSETTAIFKHLCKKENVPVQTFTMRSDMPCGSTIGPMTSAHTGVKTIDVGVPTFAMHSIRETAGKKDTFSLYKVMKRYFE